MAEHTESAQPSPPLSRDEIILALRREVVAGELQILELNDRMLVKDTDRADAVALLGQAELMLEEKIAYIMTLDQALNARIRELEAECDRKTAEIDRRGEALSAAQAEGERGRLERDAVIKDLSDRLEAANQEINRAHELARDFAEKFNLGQTSLAEARAEASRLEAEKAETAATLDARDNDLKNARARVAALEAVEQTQHGKLMEMAVRLADQQTTVALIKRSALWRLSRPWRALFGPKS